MFEKLLPHREHRQGGLKRREDEQQHPLVRLRRDFDEIWDRFLEEGRGDGLASDASMMGTHLQWEDKEDEYVLRAELPGFEPSEIDVKLTGNLLTLQAEHREEGKEEEGAYHRYGSFYESFRLPQNVQEEKIDARYHSGVLELHLPKSASSEAKRIAVKPV